MKNQILAIVITTIMHFYVGTALLIFSSSYGSGTMSTITHLIIFCSACFYSIKIKLCPDLENHLLLSIIETAIGIGIIEFMMGLWSGVEKIVLRIIKCGLSDEVRMEKSSEFADMIVLGLAVCVLLTVMIDGKFVEKVVAYYEKNMRGTKCAPQSRSSAPQQQRARPNSVPKMVRNPNCPCHGDNVMNCTR